MRIAFFTALKEERRALRLAWPLEDSGSLKGIEFDSGERAVGFCTGVGAERMTAAVLEALRLFRPELAVLIGFSAGLRADLAVGEIVVDERGDPALLRALRGYPLPLRFGRTVSSGLLRTVEDKRHLAASHPESLVADMESLAFMEAVGKTPHLVLRTVSDELETPLPLPFDEMLTARGFPDERKILREVALKPRVLPGLLGLARASSQAQQALSSTMIGIRPLLIRRLLENH